VDFNGLIFHPSLFVFDSLKTSFAFISGLSSVGFSSDWRWTCDPERKHTGISDEFNSPPQFLHFSDFLCPPEKF
jgi:hypothetical protein